MPKRPPSPAPLPRILVNYQPDDAVTHAHRLARVLRRRFGGEIVETRDGLLAVARPSARGGTTSDRAVLLVIIGKNWRRTGEASRSKSGRVAAASNKATAEAAFAARGVIPVLVDGASMPAGKAFRGAVDFARLSARAVRLRDESWEQDFEKLAAAVERLCVQEETDVTGARAPERERGSKKLSDYIELRFSRETAIELLTSLTLYLGSIVGDGKKRGGRGEDKLGTRYVRFGYGGGKGYYRAVSVGGKGGRGAKSGKGKGKGAAVVAGPAYGGNAADVVACTVYAPPKVSRGELFMVQVAAHLPEDAREAARLAKDADADAERRATKTLDSEVERGSRLTFDLSLPGMEVDEPRQSLVWRGRPEAVQFGVVVPDSHRAGNVLGTVVVSQGSVPFGHIKFKIEVGAAESAGAATTARAEAELVRYHKAFISYASKDRNEVLKRVQMLAIVKLDFFQDLLSLEPGERWQKALYKHIDESDVFLLFWSKSARRSKWVMKEVRYALGRKAKDETAPPEIVPVIIEGPPPVKPPPDLAGLHFNDKILYFVIDEEG